MEQKIARILIDAFKRGNKALIAGNGGSASMSNHFAGEFVCSYLHKERKGLPAISLSANSSILTAWSNDVDFIDVFRRQVEALGKEGDVLITLSTSGKSINLLEAIEEAKKIGMIVIDFPRIKGKSGPVQDYQLSLMHKVCEIVEKAFL